MTEMGIDEVVRRIGAALDNTNRIRDRALVDSRQVIRQAALAVRALHRSEAEVAAEHLEKGRRLLESLQA
ncbi:MAG: haloacid dehalogenase, partial [Chloroflexota bacterium]